MSTATSDPADKPANVAARREGLLAWLAQPRAPVWRTLEYFALVRVLVASSLVLSVAAFGTPPRPGEATILLPPLGASIAYFVLAAGVAILALYVRQNYKLQVVGQLAVDLVAISLLVAVSGGTRGGMMVLYLLPIAGAALLSSTLVAFFVCSLGVVYLLLDTALRVLTPDGQEPALFQTGLYGAALFAITGLLGVLATRLATQESLALRRGRDLRNQLEINRLVIANMEQGVLVVDATTRVRANNRAARVLLSLHPETQLTGRSLTDYAHMQPLAQAFLHWREGAQNRGSWSDTILQPVAAPASEAPALTEMRLRARFARPKSETSDEFVIFLEDVRALEERAQQLKLAAMGRLTAAIAHEIRNPLAAISHAGQLLSEDAAAPLQQRLAGIVRENTQRLNRLVEDVLRVARRESPIGDELDLAAFVQEWLIEFGRDRDLPVGTVRPEIATELAVRFEQAHLRQVLFNLVDNALRYASKTPGCVTLLGERARDDRGSVRLWVFDDGPGVAPDARAALFEPFFTTHTRGTGLGLYIAREFCLANRSELQYAARHAPEGLGSAVKWGFMLRFARGDEADAETRGFLDTMPVA
ncbi:MAG TPA: PAS domain-containing sensor histidine kinase [Burkholderiaceae bacterium]|nr:PAS domain-containing sensor histidine kinase [Burkholderiaceae bacterium]